MILLSCEHQLTARSVRCAEKTDVVHGIPIHDFVLANHPLRAIRLVVNEAMARLSGLFNTIYAGLSRASIPLEKLLRTTLVLCSERQ